MLMIRCPGCDVETSLSLIESDYEGPYRCWKCKALFTLRIEGEELKSCELMDEEKLEER